MIMLLEMSLVMKIMFIAILIIVTMRDLPQTYTEAVNCPESLAWRNAMDEEMKLLRENNFLHWVCLSKNAIKQVVHDIYCKIKT